MRGVMLGLKHPFLVGSVFAAVGLLFAGSALRLNAQDQAAGKVLFQKRCGGCHALDRDKEGPRLQGVYGRTAGAVDSFEYSDALKKSNIVWNEETLDRWLENPEGLVANNDMAFRLDNPTERSRIIAFLKSTNH